MVLWKASQPVSSPNSCLMLIDVQNGFINDNTKHILPRIEQLVKDFSEHNKGSLIVATQFINKDESPFINFLGWNSIMGGEETELCLPSGDIGFYTIEKSGYSGYFNTKAFGIDTVYLAGVDTDACVLETAMDFFQNNIRPIVLEHYCASSGGEEIHEAAIKILRRNIGDKQIIEGEINFS